jgi:UDP-N-acetyl-2-amino-2-deoxyglucuronate dehydrogenase
MTERKVRFGMIGCGQIMPSTADGILSSAHCEIIGVMDADEEAAKAMSEKYGVPYSIDLFKFLENGEMDAVYIAVPHALHVPIGVEAARAGKHVMVEKPMATAVEDAQMLIKECKDAGVKLSVAMGGRYSSTSVISRELIEKGAIGDFSSYLVRSIGMKDAKYWSNGVFGMAKRSYWRAFKGMSGGGILVMNAVHNLDALYYITGVKPMEVMAMGGNYASRSALEDSISLLVRFDKNNAYGVCQAMSAAHGASHTDNSTFIYGTQGTIRFAPRNVELFTTVEGLGYETGKFVTISAESGKGGRDSLMDGFAQAILSDSEPFITGEEGLMITDLMLSAYDSMRLGQTVRLSTAK